jgi:hypothetical protein
VNKSGFYAEFKDREDLFVQSLGYYLEGLEKKGLLTTEPLGWNNIERFLKRGTSSLARDIAGNSITVSSAPGGADQSVARNAPAAALPYSSPMVRCPCWLAPQALGKMRELLVVCGRFCKKKRSW